MNRIDPDRLFRRLIRQQERQRQTLRLPPARRRTGDDLRDGILAIPPHYADQAQTIWRRGTAVVFGVTGSTTVAGETVTNNFGLDALASASGRMGVEADLTDDMPEYLLVFGVVETGTAPVAATSARFFLAFSQDGVNYPAGVTGADAAWPSDGNETEWEVQLGRPCSVLVATNDGTVIQQQQPRLILPLGQFMAPVVNNLLGQAFRDEVTAADNGSGLVVYPYRRFLIDP